MQPVPGLDALKLIPMIVQAANRACMHKKNCKQFAQHLQLIGNLLEVITISKIKRCREARQPLELLEEALRKSYPLVKRCQNWNFLSVLFMGWNIENQFRELENEIDRFLKIVPLIHLADNARVMELLAQIRHDKEKAERAAAKERAERKERAAAKERAERAAAKERAERKERAAAKERAERAAAKERAERAAARERAERKERAAAKERAERVAATERAERAAARERTERKERAAAKERAERAAARERAERKERAAAKERAERAAAKERAERAARRRTNN